MSAPRLLEVGGCEGASTEGWQRAGWVVTTVDTDLNRLRYNPAEEKVHADGLEVLANLDPADYEAVSLHPPCQWYTRGRAKDRGRPSRWDRTIPPWREAVRATGLPYVIENVKDAGWDMRAPVTLCGCMFGLGATDTDGTWLRLLRPRLFESGRWTLLPVGICHHRRGVQYAGVYGGARRDKHEARHVRKGGYVPPDKAVAQALLGIDPGHAMTWQGLYEAVPPIYTAHVGLVLREELGL